MSPDDSAPSPAQQRFGGAPELDNAYASVSETEVVIGLVYGSGADVEPFLEALDLELQGFAYATETIRPSERLDPLFNVGTANPERPDWVTRHQELGDALRENLSDNSAMAKLAMAMIGEARTKRQGANTDERLAWIVRSLKRPEEVKELRRVYGARFILMSLHVPEATRLKAASRRLQRTSPISGARFDVHAVEQIARDLEDAERDYGQNMRHTFPEADFFVDASSPRALSDSVGRVIRVMSVTRLQHLRATSTRCRSPIKRRSARPKWDVKWVLPLLLVQARSSPLGRMRFPGLVGGNTGTPRTPTGEMSRSIRR